ncbi:hypothetical protein K469DRAFT_729878 [Zopfia rhizophila CBS 207.26]|uniref:MFS general substrate transporter n=1 Tax=Zopfia rhizophila CBS 207.26 TaxID=1314779 RepID=A0A6A6DR40_9PEZI|nr:hypothetical protein K469DRAFT_729878 [Zopfia rhizophila CBS 207.26]
MLHLNLTNLQASSYDAGNESMIAVFHVAYIVFELFLFGSTFTDRFATVVVIRFFGGGASSVSINISGSISDVWKRNKARNLPMSLFGFTSVEGIALGPFIGVEDPRRWGDVIFAKRASKFRKATGRPVYAESQPNKASIPTLLKITFLRPTKMLLTEPVLTFTLWISFTQSILILFFASVVQTFGTNYGWEWFYLRTAHRNTECPAKPIPEGRLYTSIPGSILFTGGLFMYGCIYMDVVNYLTGAYEKYVASALSTASLRHNSFGAFLTLASYRMFNNFDFGWAGSLLGFIGAIRSSPFMLESTYAPEDAERRRSSLHGAGAMGAAGVPPRAVGDIA